jgi:hypothetical protein|tara:strand:- start:941 stop:1351 length:411 start_codon:yes stop_codon:yes gene_type:complete
MLKTKYNKEKIEIEAKASAEQGYITNDLGSFILNRSRDISHFAFITNGNEELRQSLIDEAVMRVCLKFLDYYKPEKSAANLIISMIYSTMTNKIVSLKWRDVYGQRIKGRVLVIENGEAKYKLVRYIKDEQISKEL